ncbi:MAG: aminoacyl-tRNA hydrolase [Patescibacteria group bacterium]
MKLIIGLGNPGAKYHNTRHNLGFRAVDVLARETKWQDSKKFQALMAEANINGQKILLAKPQTFMNESGQAARSIIDFYKIPLADMLVIYDDIDLLVGDTRLRAEGSAGGHNGMASIIEHLGTEAVARFRLGVAEAKTGKQDIPAEDYVLLPASAAGEDKIKTTLAQMPELVNSWLLA